MIPTVPSAQAMPHDTDALVARKTGSYNRLHRDDGDWLLPAMRMVRCCSCLRLATGF